MYHVTITTTSASTFAIDMDDDTLEGAFSFMAGESMGTMDCVTRAGDFVAFAPGSIETLSYATKTESEA